MQRSDSLFNPCDDKGAKRLRNLNNRSMDRLTSFMRRGLGEFCWHLRPLVCYIMDIRYQPAMLTYSAINCGHLTVTITGIVRPIFTKFGCTLGFRTGPEVKIFNFWKTKMAFINGWTPDWAALTAGVAIQWANCEHSRLLFIHRIVTVKTAQNGRSSGWKLTR